MSKFHVRITAQDGTEFYGVDCDTIAEAEAEAERWNTGGFVASVDAPEAPAEKLPFRIGLRLDGQRAAQIVWAANVDEAIARVRVGVWAHASVASVSIVKGRK